MDKKLLDIFVSDEEVVGITPRLLRIVKKSSCFIGISKYNTPVDVPVFGMFGRVCKSEVIIPIFKNEVGMIYGKRLVLFDFK